MKVIGMLGAAMFGALMGACWGLIPALILTAIVGHDAAQYVPAVLAGFFALFFASQYWGEA